MNKANVRDSFVEFEFDEVTDITEDNVSSENQISTSAEDSRHPAFIKPSSIKPLGKMTAMTSLDEDDMEPQLDEQLDNPETESAIFDAPFEEIPDQILDFNDENTELLGAVGGPSTMEGGAIHALGPSTTTNSINSSQEDDSQVERVNDVAGGVLGGAKVKSEIKISTLDDKQQLPQMLSSTPAGDDDEDEDTQAPPAEGSYDPADYEHLDVGPELKELFSYIVRYTPQTIDLEHRLRPYIPDYIPAVGDIDAFIKIPRPDGEGTTVGLTVLDEPNAQQSDTNVLDLQLRAVAKHTTTKSAVVKVLENGEKNAKVVEKWIKDISELHRAKPPPTVHYSKRMPDIDSLMQEWPHDLEELFKNTNLPSAALQVELPHYVDILCAMLDIPVYKNRIQSLHVLFTLYSVFKSSAHFRHLAQENIMDNTEEEEADRLVIQ